MAFELFRAPAADRDLDMIFEHLVESYLSLGDDLQDAVARAATRLKAIDRDMLALVHAPHQGSLRHQISPGLRQVTKNRTIFYFKVDEAKREVKVLAVFFRGQDHEKHILKRLGNRSGDA
jgi:plasmid stabilization system protein ParE